MTEIALPAADLVAELRWIGDRGRRFLAVEKTGVLHRVSAPPSPRAELRLELEAEASFVAVSQAGLLVVLSSSQEVLVLDPMDLEVKGSVAVPAIDRVASSPQLDLAYGTGGRSESLAIIDLSSRRVVRQIRARDLWAGRPESLIRSRGSGELRDFGQVTVTPDGRYLFCHSFGTLHRFRITGHGLSYEESVGRVPARGRLEISPDSLYVTVGGSAVFRVTDLETPAVALGAGSHPQGLSFDPASGRILAYDRDGHLIVFSASGEKIEEYALTERWRGLRQILPHPKGRGVLLLTEDQLLWVEW